MSPRWPSGRPADEVAATAAPVPAAAPFAMPDDPEAACEKLETDLHVARDEQGAAHAVLASARAALPGSAREGIDAVRGAQRSVREAEERVRLAEEVVTALAEVHRPIAAAAHAVRRERRREELAGQHGAAVAAVDQVDEALLAALVTLASVAERRRLATEAAHAIEKTAAAEGLVVGTVERYILPERIREAIRRVGLLAS